MSIPAFGIFIETIWRQNVTRVSRIYYSYVFFYNIIYFYFWGRHKAGIHRNDDIEISGVTITNILFGAMAGYFCGVYDVLDVMFFNNSYNW